jgi:hypothetical protein
MKLRALFLGTCVLAASACASEPRYDDSAPDVEDDGKADGSNAFLGTKPYGVFYAADDAESGFAVVEIKRDNSYRRETFKFCDGDPCNKVETGKVKFTTGNSTYIRFLKSNGALRDKYAYQMHGIAVDLRKANSDTWQRLMPEDRRGEIDSEYAGIYTNYGRGGLEEGTIFELQLEDSGYFKMDVEGMYGCSMPGHTCPEDYINGPSGDTDLEGRWEHAYDDPEVSGDAEGVYLIATDPLTGRESPPARFDMVRDGARMRIDGFLGPHAITGDLFIEALSNKTHSVDDHELDGTWIAIDDNRDEPTIEGDKPDYQTIWGYGDVVNDGPGHALIFDSTTSELLERSANINHDPPENNVFTVLGDPAGRRGMLYVQRGSQFTVLKIKKRTSTELVLSFTDNGDGSLSEERDLIFRKE